MLNNVAIVRSGLKAIDKLAVRSALASLEILKDVGRDLGKAIDSLTAEDLGMWIRSK